MSVTDSCQAISSLALSLSLPLSLSLTHTHTHTRTHTLKGGTHLSFSVLALDLHVVVGDLHVELIWGEVLDVQVDAELVSVRPHLGNRDGDGERI